MAFCTTDSIDFCCVFQLSTKLLQEGQHDELDRVMKDKERQQRLEREAAEAEFDAEEAENIKHLMLNTNDELTKGVKSSQRDVLVQVSIGLH